MLSHCPLNYYPYRSRKYKRWSINVARTSVPLKNSDLPLWATKVLNKRHWDLMGRATNNVNQRITHSTNRIEAFKSKSFTWPP
jgi:hypothetical protein